MRKIPLIYGWLGTLLLASATQGQVPTPADSTLLTSRQKPTVQKTGRRSGLSSVLPLDVSALRSEPGPDALDADELPDLGLKVASPKKKKKGPKPVSPYARSQYEGVPVAHVINKIGAGDRITTEEFFVLKTYQAPSPYVKEIYWYDVRASRVTTSVIKDKAYAQILHGPYRKHVGGALIEEGYYYLGTKHDRWETFFPDFTLKDKVHYERGFPKGSVLTYYDEAKKKLKSVVPIQYGKATGLYRSFYEGGQLQEEGRLDDSVRVGVWREYYQFGPGGRTKRDTQYGRDKWEQSEPVVLREYDEKGKLTFDNKTRRKEETEPDEF